MGVLSMGLEHCHMGNTLKRNKSLECPTHPGTLSQAYYHEYMSPCFESVVSHLTLELYVLDSQQLWNGFPFMEEKYEMDNDS